MSKQKNENLYKYSVESPWQFVFLVLLYTVGAVGFPESIFTFFLGESLQAQAISRFLARAICCILPIWLLFEIKAQNIFRVKGFFNKFVLIIPFILVAVNNFPILPLSTKEVHFVFENCNFSTWFTYLLAVFGGVVLEEIAFRGIIFTVLYRKLKSSKKGIFLTVLYSSLIFGGAHLFNLLAGAGIGSVVMQMGYSLLIGGMCAIGYLVTGNFYNAVLLHFIFNIGGLLYDYNMIIGNIWTTGNIILTAVLAVIVIAYALPLLFKSKGENLNEKLDPQGV